MLKIKKTKVKLGGAVFAALLFCESYIGVSFYSVPEQVHAAGMETRKLSDIKYLQEMNKYICDNSAVGDNNTVLDIRDNNDYTIGKLADGKCWMTQNLRLAGNSKLTSEDSNVSSDYTLPSSTSGAFSSTDPTNGQMGNSSDNDYGAYYSFNAATAGSASSKTSGNAQYDICPKGWRLPTGGDYGEFYKLAQIYPAGNLGNVQTNTTGWTTAGVNNKAGRWLGAANTVTNPLKVTNGGAFFPAAGYMDSSSASVQEPSSRGLYWSNMIYMESFARYMDFNGSELYPTRGLFPRSFGFSVRCITNEKILESEDFAWSSLGDSASGSIAVKVANTLSIDAVSGMEEEVDSTSVANGTITATIAANTNYKVLLNAEKTSLTSANSANTAEIPASTNVAAGTNAWGIRTSDNSTYTAITTKAEEYHNTTTPSTNPAIPGTVHTFNIGISVSPSLPADIYSTEVTITAAAA